MWPLLLDRMHCQNNIDTFFEPTDFNNETPIETVARRNEGLMLLCSVCGNDQGVRPYDTGDTRPPKVRKKRRCLVEVDGRKCPDPFNCRGKNDRRNCILHHKGDLSKLTKRKVQVKYTKKCRMCHMDGCPGVSKRERCKNINVVAI